MAGSLLTSTVRAFDIPKVRQADGKPRSLREAIAGLGKLPKPVHLLQEDQLGARGLVVNAVSTMTLT